MSGKNINDVLDIAEQLTNGVKLDICGVAFDRDEKMGEFVVIKTVDGKKYKTYSTYIVDRLKQVEAKKFDFKKDVLKAQVFEKVSESTGNTYLTLGGQK
jgi:hypothetical protein